MLTEAGQADFEFELISLDDDFNRNTCDAVAAQMRDAGMKVKRTVLPGNTFWNNWIGYPFSATEWNMRPLGVQVYALGLPHRRAVERDRLRRRRVRRRCSTRPTRIADADAAPRADGARWRRSCRTSGILIQPYWRSTFRHMTADVHGLVMHPTFEIHLENAPGSTA